jgi:hypothetical protein
MYAGSITMPGGRWEFNTRMISSKPGAPIHCRVWRGNFTSRFFARRSGAASHCQMGGLHAAQASIFDWLDDLMRLEPAPGPLCVPRELVEALKRYHGTSVGEELDLDRKRHTTESTIAGS